MKFILTKPVLDRFPKYTLGLVILRHVNNRNKGNASKILELLRKEETKIRKEFTGQTLSTHSHIQAWNQAFQEMGLGQKYKCSVHALALRVVQGYDLPDINPLVNLYNYVSLKHLIAFGGENLDATMGHARLTPATGEEKYYAIGSVKNKPPQPGEIVWKDDIGITCRAWNWRQSERTKIDDNTQYSYHVIDVMPPWGKKETQSAAEEFCDLAKSLLNANYDIYYADKDNPEIDIDFEQTFKPLVSSDEKSTTPLSPPKLGGEAKISKAKFSQGGYPHQPTAYDIHTRGASLKNYILYPGSSGLEIRDSIVRTVQKLWEQKDLPKAEFPVIEIEHPADPAHGDWSCNIALRLAKYFKQKPFDIAQTIKDELLQEKNPHVQQIEVASPGFINFTLNPTWLTGQAQNILEQKDDFGRLETRAGKAIMIEHTQPNSHKALHIGHLRNTFLGMAEVRAHQALGYKVISTTYGGDIGPHVAKCLWGLLDKKVDFDKLPTLDEKVQAIQDAYVYGTQKEMQDEKVKQEVAGINKALYARSDPELVELWQKTFTWSVDKHKELYQRVGTQFDRYYWESEVWEKGLEIVKQNVGKIFEKSQGAIIFDGEKYDLHKRVFITGQGTAPYEAKDLGLELLKVSEYVFDFSIIQTGNDHIDYFAVVLKALELVLPELAGIFENETFGMVNLPSGKMSTRRGNTITADDILDEMHTLAYEEVSKRYEDMSEEQKHEIAEIIAIGATKYTLLKYDPKQDITFDPKSTLSFNGNNGPYLQYVCVRIQSMLDKAHKQGLKPEPGALGQTDYLTTLHPAELTLLRHLYQFPEIIICMTLEYKPNYLCTYLFELASKYNDFYLACPVLKADEQTASARLALSEATRQVLANGLTVLGISIPLKM